MVAKRNAINNENRIDPPTACPTCGRPLVDDFADVTVDHDRYEIHASDKIVRLTQTEFSLFWMLYRKRRSSLPGRSMGTHKTNPHQLKISRFRKGHRQVMVFRGLGEEVRIFIDLVLWQPFERHLSIAAYDSRTEPCRFPASAVELSIAIWSSAASPN